MVKAELNKLGLHYRSIDLGEVDVVEEIYPEQMETLRIGLKLSGLELMDDKLAVLIASIKKLILENIYYADEIPAVNISEYLSKALHTDYAHLSALFTEATGTTIERYTIIHKIEKVKELLIYDGLTLTDISYRLNYSSVAHLSAQFKKITGLTPTFYKKIKNKRIRKGKK
jgi:AraC-like DNA-binding protein